jgi:hypothetical protein
MFSFTTISPVSMPTYVELMLGSYSIGSTVAEAYTDLDATGDSDAGSTATFGLAAGFTADTGITFSISGTSETKSYSGTASSSIATHFSPSTASETVGSDSGPPSSASYSTTYTLNQTNSGSTNRSGTTSEVTHSEDTFHGNSGSWGDETDYTAGVTYDTVTSGSTSNGTFSTGSYPASSSTNSTQTISTRASSTARTGSGTISSEFRDTYTYGYASRTTTESLDSDCPRVTTTSGTYDVEGADPPTTASSWDFDYTMVNAAHTATTMDFDTDTLTVEGDSTSQRTENFTSGTTTGTRLASSFARTTSIFHQLEDTIYRLSDGGSDFLRGYMVWSMTQPAPSASTYTGKFTDLYVASTGQSFTISDYQKFSTNSLPIPIVSLSRAATTTQATTGTGTGTGTSESSITVTLTNGHPVFTTSAWTNTFSLGDISTSASMPTGTQTATTTRFTHVDFVSGYATSGNRPFTTGTTVGFWESTSQTGVRDAWASSYTTTATKNSRHVTSDVVLRNVQTVTMTTGTSSYLSFLGLSRFTTSRIIQKVITVPNTAWSVGYMLENWTSSNVLTNTADTNEAKTRITSRSGSHDLTHSTKERLMARTYGGILSPPAYNEAWMTTPARGWAGFCGSFTQTSPAIYLTTTSGLAAGATFSDASPAIYLGTKGMNEDGVKIVPCHESTGITLGGVGLVKSSLISVPSALTSALSIAATWTSTSEAGTSTVVSTRSATHTAAMQSLVTGEYWTKFPITFDSGADIGYNGPHASIGGYVAGDNRMGTHEVRVNAGAVSWTQFTASASDTTGVTGATSGTDESASFTVSQGAAVRIAVEPIITVSWIPTNNYPYHGDHIIPTSPHQPFLYASAP